MNVSELREWFNSEMKGKAATRFGAFMVEATEAINRRFGETLNVPTSDTDTNLYLTEHPGTYKYHLAMQASRWGKDYEQAAIWSQQWYEVCNAIMVQDAASVTDGTTPTMIGEITWL